MKSFVMDRLPSMMGFNFGLWGKKDLFSDWVLIWENVAITTSIHTYDCILNLI